MARLSSAVDRGENPCVGEGAKEHVGLSWGSWGRLSKRVIERELRFRNGYEVGAKGEIGDKHLRTYHCKNSGVC